MGGQGVDEDNVGSITFKKEKLKIRKSYMENEAFLSKNCYGGGKRKRNDSDLEYDPEDAKRRKQSRARKKQQKGRKMAFSPTFEFHAQKKRRARKKQNRKRKTGDKRSSQQKARVQVANARTNADRPKGDDRPPEQKARVQVANDNRPKGDNRPSE